MCIIKPLDYKLTWVPGFVPHQVHNKQHKNVGKLLLQWFQPSDLFLSVAPSEEKYHYLNFTNKA